MALLRGARKARTGWSHVLVGTDFSANSEMALKRALVLPLVDRARVTILHVLPKKLPGSVSGDVERAAARAVERVEARARRMADRMGRGDLHIRARLERGEPWERLARAAQSEDVDLVVLGRHGASTLKEQLLGSTAERLVRAAEVPVLIVTRRSTRPYRKPLFALDFERESHVVLDTGIRATPEARSRIRIVHAYEHGYELVLRQVNASDEKIRKYREEALQAAHERSREFLELWKPQGFKFDVIMDPADPRESILNVAEADGSDLLVLGTHARTGPARYFLGSVAESVLRKAKCDVLLVRVAQPVRRRQAPAGTRGEAGEEAREEGPGDVTEVDGPMRQDPSYLI